MDYIVFGNVMLDTVLPTNGVNGSNRENMGGPATFAYAGIRLWTDSVMQSSKVGEDYHPLFDPWIAKNNVISDGFEVVTEHCNHSYLVYNEDGTYSGDESVKRFRSDWIQDFGYMKTRPEQISRWTQNKDVKGIYVAQSVDRVWWRELKKIKARDGFKVMWEIEGPSSYYEFMDEVLNAMQDVDIFSINIQEASNLFNVETEEACIKKLQEMPVDMTLFRVGARGLYAVTKDKVYYLPPAPGEIVDPTGCGNTSTGAALFAYAEGFDPLMAGVMANVAAAQNIRQYGVIPNFAGVRGFANAQAKALYAKYAQKYL
ncbi:MAG TPA: carbohydrate kinase family protein [Clostridia bacterium]|nr:carbohydrate kinase family protein [Clostridia bacterium]